MKILTKYICIVFFGMILQNGISPTVAAEANVDHLLNQIKKKSPKEKATIYKTLSSYYQYRNKSKHKEYTLEYLKLAKTLDDENLLFDAYIQTALMYSQIYDLKNSRIHADQAFDLSIKYDNDLWYAKALIFQANYSLHNFLLEEASIQADAVLEIYDENNLKILKAYPYLIKTQIAEYKNNLKQAEFYLDLLVNTVRSTTDTAFILPFLKYEADYYMRRGNFTEAFAKYNKLSEYESNNQLDYAHAESLVGIGRIYLSLNECNQAEDILKQAFLLSMSSGNKLSKGRVLKYLGNCFTKNMEYTKAEKKYYQALDIFTEIKDKLQTARTYNNLGVTHYLKQRYQKSEEFLNKALEIYEDYPFLYSKSKTYRNKAVLYSLQNNSKEAVEYFKKSNELAKQGNYTEVLSMNYTSLAAYYSAQKNYEKAFEYANLATRNQQEKRSLIYTKLIELQQRYKNELRKKEYNLKNEKFLHKKNLESQKAKYKGILTTLGVVLFGLITLIVYILKKSRSKQIKLSQTIEGHKLNIDQKEKDILISKYTFNNLGDGIIWVNKNGRVIYHNKMALAYSKKQNIKNIEDVFDHFNKTGWLKQWNKLVSIESVFIEESKLSINQKTIPVEVSYSIMLFEKAEYVSISFKDITFRKKTEQSLRDAKNRAEESEKLKSRFLANMSHEIRTPLNTIDGFAAELLHEDDPEEKVHCIEMIEKSSKRLIRLIDNIIIISELESKDRLQKKDHINLHELLKELVDNYKTNLNPGVEIYTEFEYKNDKVIVYADDQGYYQVLEEQVSNAVKFTKHGEIKIGYKFLNNQQVEVYVSDTGVGIKAEYQKHIFDIFSQADISDTRKFQGSGLGLSITKKLIEKMDGRIRFESTENVGSTFFTIIKADRIPDKKPLPIRNGNLEGENIFFISDSETNIRYFKALFKKSGAHLTTFQNYKLALEKISIEKPQVIILCKSMLVHGEFKLCNQIKKIHPKSVVILQSEKKLSENSYCDAIIDPNANKSEIYQTIINHLKPE